MKSLSLKDRVRFSFVLANIVILIMMFVVFNYLDVLNKKIQDNSAKANQTNLLTDEVRISAVSILKHQRLFEDSKSKEEMGKIINLCESFTFQLHSLDTIYKNTEAKKVIAQMLSYVDSLKLLLTKAAFISRDEGGMQAISELVYKILNTYTEFQDIQYSQIGKNDKQLNNIIKETKRQMMIILILGFLFTIILSLIVPSQIALPFKKLKDAIFELQSCNFDVSIFYDQKDEIGDLAIEMNKMIYNLKVFEELRIDRIAIEHRKFDTLANIVKKPLLLTNADNRLVYMNNRLYSILQVQSEDILGKELTENLVPKSIMEAMELAIQRRSKIENAPIKITKKKVIVDNESQEEDETQKALSDIDDDNIGDIKAVKFEEEEVFEGYANVIPIRGKDSSLDYYLMVISKEVVV